jgi:PAS domain S-box-containing protein
MPQDGSPRAQGRGVLVPILLGAGALGGLYASRLYSYLLFHGLAELFSIVVACAIFLIAWNARSFIRNSYLLLLGVAFLFVGVLDLVHTLAYGGMGVFPGVGSNLPTQLWIAARGLEALTLLAAPFFLGRRLNVQAAVLVYAALTAAILASVFIGPIFPTCFVDGQGLTAFKIYSEYAICAVMLAAGALLYARRAAFEPRVVLLVEASIAMGVAAELVFTLYGANVYGPANLAGHFMKIVAFYLIYKAIIETGLVEPYALLFRELKQSEDALREARDGLEVRVLERTAELEREAAVRQRAQEALRRSEERFRMLAENARDIVFRCHTRPRLAVDYVSPAIGAILGYAPEEFYADPDLLTRIAHPADRAALQERLTHPEGATEPFVVRWRSKEGALVWTEQTLVPVRNGRGATVAVEGIARDITERQKSQERILAYQKQLRSLASELLLAEERERRSIAADLHDGPCQTLAAARIKIGMLNKVVPPGQPGAALGEVRDLIDQSIRDTRSLTFEISPPVLYEIGLEAAFDWLVDQFGQRYGIRTEFVSDGLARPFDEDVRILLFRAVRELLINVAKHARARRATVSLEDVDGGVRITVRDDGVGFDAAELRRPARGAAGFGLFNIRERLEHLGGEVVVQSSPGQGTRVMLSAPMKRTTAGREAAHGDQSSAG